MTNKPKQPRGPGGKFVKAGVETILTARGQTKIDNYIKRFGGDSAQIISDIHAAKVSHMHRNPIAIPIESTPGVDREFSTDDIVSMNERFARNIGNPLPVLDQVDHDFSRIAPWLFLVAVLIVAAVLWIKP